MALRNEPDGITPIPCSIGLRLVVEYLFTIGIEEKVSHNPVMLWIKSRHDGIVVGTRHGRKDRNKALRTHSFSHEASKIWQIISIQIIGTEAIKGNEKYEWCLEMFWVIDSRSGCLGLLTGSMSGIVFSEEGRR